MIANGETSYLAAILGVLVVTSAITSAGLIVVLRPFLVRYALARPNARSSHKLPTPQGAGIAVVAVTIVYAAGVGLALTGGHIDLGQLAIVFAATTLLSIVGAVDDVRVLDVFPRLLLQLLAVAAVVTTLPSEIRILHVLPLWVERTFLVLGGIWFVNLVNFMDGIDLMTVAEFVPATAGLAFFGLVGALPQGGMFAATILLGAIVGFAPFNRPVARLFLGDVGSLAIGLLLVWMLVLLAGNGHLSAAVLLPLYYIADTTITLLRRLIRGESVLQAHRDHFYQRAMDHGYSVYQIVGRVFGTNIILCGLAVTTLLNTTFILHATLLVLGCALVGTLLCNLNRGRV